MRFLLGFEESKAEGSRDRSGLLGTPRDHYIQSKRKSYPGRRARDPLHLQIGPSTASKSLGGHVNVTELREGT